MQVSQHSHVVQVAGLVIAVPGRMILDGCDLAVLSGESVAVMGPSGSGKTTLLNCIAGLARPQAGTVVADGVDMTRAREGKAAAHRLSRIGIVFQSSELMHELTVLENVLLPGLLARNPDGPARAHALLDEVGMGAFDGAMPDTLSGGEAQRVAIARALMNRPAVVLADEPTGALDAENGAAVVRVLTAACAAGRTALIVATHDPAVARAADRTVRLVEGRLATEMSVEASV